jgi:hypothetical protein
MRLQRRRAAQKSLDFGLINNMISSIPKVVIVIELTQKEVAQGANQTSDKDQSAWVLAWFVVAGVTSYRMAPEQIIRFWDCSDTVL